MHHVLPLLVALGYLIEVLLYLGCKVVVHYLTEVLHQEIIDYCTDISWYQLTLIRSSHFLAGLLCNLLTLELIDRVEALLALLVATGHVLALLDGRDGWSIGRRTANAKFFHLVHQTGLSVSLWTSAETLCGQYLTTCKLLILLHCRQAVAVVL